MDETPPAPHREKSPLERSTEVPRTLVETQVETNHQEPPPPSSAEPPSITATTSTTTLLSPLVPPPTTITATTTPSPVPPPIAPTGSALQPFTTTSTPSLPSNSNLPPPSTQNIQPRTATPTPSSFSQPWQQQQTPLFTHYSLASSASTSSPSLPSSASPLLVQRVDTALGVPAHHPPPRTPLTSSFNNPPFGPGRNMPDTMPSFRTSQVRQPIQGVGITGSLGASSTLRPTVVPGQSSVGPPSGLNMQSLTTQTFQGHNMFRGQSLGPSGSCAANTGQIPQNQPWLSKAQVQSPMAPQSIRPQMNPQSVQQRAHIPQQKQQSISTTMQQQQAPTQVKQLLNTSQPLEQLQQQYPPPRAQLPVPPQQQIGKNQGLGIQRSSSQGVMQAGATHSGPPSRPSIEETEDTCNRILSKRTIHELVNQIDSSEKLEPEVEDILVDIAEEFVESISTFGCSLAKHRKSTVLEAKDILLHVERNWNMTLPGFGGDEIKIYKKPLANDLHKERLAVIKKSIVASESTNAKSSAGQATGSNPKSHSAKGPANMLGSPNT